ncbi:MAG TPA: hypothetical protein VJA23_00710 [Candidatus Nanoarchaeia archaeon]|nr:hypothetical protein [Candidatus Nanoarchaeia archaeon]
MERKELFFLLAVVMVIVVMAGVFFSTGVTGGTIIKSIYCYNDLDCDDGKENTLDFCQYAGTEQSLCVNKEVN